jgi:hypothetical protein
MSRETPGAPWQAARRRLTGAQKRVIDSDDVNWEGWDAKGRPVVGAYYYAGFLQNRATANPESTYRSWALKKNGDPTDVTEPVDRRSL